MPRPADSGPAEAAKVQHICDTAAEPATVLLEQAARYVQVVELPDDVAALRRLVGDQAVAMAKLLVLVDRLEARLEWLADRDRQRGAP